MHLSQVNAHIRDKDIQFIEEGHIYIIKKNPNIKYMSTTTWVHSHFQLFEADKIIQNMFKGKSWKAGHKYWGMTSQEIKDFWNKNGNEASRAGTKLHFDIECFMNNSNLNSNYSHKDLFNHYFENQLDPSSNLVVSTDWNYFIKFICDFPHMVPFRTEWTIFHDELQISGSIDMVYENPDGTLSIYDWKRCKEISKINKFNKFSIVPSVSHLPDSNFWHYTLQLNIYRYILQEKYNKTVSEICLVRLHPNAKNYELIPLPFIDQEIEDMISLRMCTF
jgi:hypothetical protein